MAKWAKCPVCGHDVRTPFFFNLDAWRNLVCPDCKARLEMKPLRSYRLSPLVVPLALLAGRGKVFAVIALAYMFATLLLMLWEAAHLQVRLRKKPLPEPTVRLNINSPSK